MSPLTTTAISFVAFFVFLMLGVPVWACMALVGFGGLVALAGFGGALNVLGVVPYSVGMNFVLTCIPTFILMGHLAFYGGVSTGLYDTAAKWLGRLPGGLGVATFGACGAFAAATGSSTAGVAALGSICVPEMRKYGYEAGLACGMVAVGGGLGILIPPSIPMVVYSMITEQSIGKQFMAGIGPGVLAVVLYMLTIMFMIRLRPGLVTGKPPKASIKEMIASLRGIWSVFVVVIVVIGGMYVGWLTPTEAGAAGAGCMLLIGLATGKLKWKGIQESIRETLLSTSFIILLVAGALILNAFLTLSGLPEATASYVATLPFSRYGILAAIVVLYLILGCFMDVLAMMLLTVPIFFPLLVGLGFSPIWFGIILMRVMEIGLFTPPFGLNVFVLSGVVPDVPMHKIFRGAAPFVLTDAVSIVLLTAWPQIALFIPDLMK